MRVIWYCLLQMGAVETLNGYLGIYTPLIPNSAFRSLRLVPLYEMPHSFIQVSSLFSITTAFVLIKFLCRRTRTGS